MNWAMNGFQSGWKGVAAFFTGAATSALSFWGGKALTGCFNASGLISGTGAGALAGGATGLVSNTLLGGTNNWINGKSFFNDYGKNVWMGLVNGAISGAISGAVAGYENAKANGLNMWWGTKVKPGRSPWNFFNNDVSYLIDFDLPYIHHKGNDCLPGTYAEIANKMGSDLTYDYFVKATRLNSDYGGAIIDKDGKFFQAFTSSAFNVDVEDFTQDLNLLYNGEFMREQAQRGSVFTIKWNDRNHIDNVHYLRFFPYAPEKNKLLFRQSIFNSTYNDLLKSTGLQIFIIRQR